MKYVRFLGQAEKKCARNSPREFFLLSESDFHLVENVPRGANLEVHGARKSRRPIPFIDEETK